MANRRSPNLPASAEKARVPLGDWFCSPLHPIVTDLARWRYQAGDFPMAERLARTVVNLPTDTLDPSKVVSFLNHHLSLSSRSNHFRSKHVWARTFFSPPVPFGHLTKTDNGRTIFFLETTLCREKTSPPAADFEFAPQWEFPLLDEIFKIKQSVAPRF